MFQDDPILSEKKKLENSWIGILITALFTKLFA